MTDSADSAPAAATDSSSHTSTTAEDKQHSAPSPFAVGDIVWAKMKGFSVWPAKVLDEVEAPEDVRTAKKKDSTLVRFFGEGTFAWMKSRELFPFRSAEFVRAKKLKTKGVQAAISEAAKEDAEKHNGVEFVPDEALTAEANSTATPGRKRPRPADTEATGSADASDAAAPAAKRRRRATDGNAEVRRSSRKSAAAEDELNKQLSEVAGDKTPSKSDKTPSKSGKSSTPKSSPRKNARKSGSGGGGGGGGGAGGESDYEEKKKRKSGKKDKKKKEDDGAGEHKKRVRVSATVEQIAQLNKQLQEATESTDIARVLEAIDGFDVSLQALQETGVGRTIRKLAKHQSSKVKSLASDLFAEWSKLIEIEAESKSDEPETKNSEEGSAKSTNGTEPSVDAKQHDSSTTTAAAAASEAKQ